MANLLEWSFLGIFLVVLGLGPTSGRSQGLDLSPLAARPVAALAWNANGETNLAGYRLHFGFSPTDLTMVSDAGLATNASVVLPVGNETYFFALSAYDTFGQESGLSQVVSNFYKLPLTVELVLAPIETARGPEGSRLPLVTPAILRDATNWILVDPPRRGSIVGKAPSFEYVPGSRFVGTDRFRFSVVHGNGVVVFQVEGQVEFAPNNLPPVASGSEIVTGFLTPVEFILSASDPDGDSLTYRIVKSPSYGWLEEDLPRVVYHPGTNAVGAPFSGADAFTFVVSDGFSDSAPALINVIVEPPVEEPTELLVSVATDEDTPVEVVLSPPALGYPPFEFEVLGLPSGAVADVFSPSFVFQPATNMFGLVDFSYRVTDSNDITVTGRVEILVRPVNDPPVAISSSVTVRSGSVDPLPIDGTDVDGDLLTFEFIEEPVHGDFLIMTEGFFFLADTTFMGQDEMLFRVSDGELESAPAVCRINVVPGAQLAVPATLELDTAGKPNLRLTWATLPGIRYVVVQSSELNSASWTRLGEAVVAQGLEMSVLIPIEEGAPVGYYAVELLGL